MGGGGEKGKITCVHSQHDLICRNLKDSTHTHTHTHTHTQHTYTQTLLKLIKNSENLQDTKINSQKECIFLYCYFYIIAINNLK